MSCIDLGLVEYAQALAWQEELVRKRCRGEVGDTLLLLEHPPVFTLGRGADERNILTARQIPVHRVSRGGEVTFHGPGQLVGYPIIDLTAHGRDVHVYLRSLEAVLIEVLAEYGVEARHAPGLTGVWVGEEKIASLGIGVRRWVTYHGFALNVDLDLSYFDDIIPCGLTGVRMTSMAESLGYAVDMASVKIRTAARLAHRLGYEEALWRKNCLTQHSALNTQH
ncbi:MAG: lipoyl(octanoyl) transferase LipB [Deltaproteobacteria bacterium]|nr:lipoyl(octanoyl) transferase LipB [Deltaproteobacteria bacterium]